MFNVSYRQGKIAGLEQELNKLKLFYQFRKKEIEAEIKELSELNHNELWNKPKENP